MVIFQTTEGICEARDWVFYGNDISLLPLNLDHKLCLLTYLSRHHTYVIFNLHLLKLKCDNDSFFTALKFYP